MLRLWQEAVCWWAGEHWEIHPCRPGRTLRLCMETRTTQASPSVTERATGMVRRSPSSSWRVCPWQAVRSSSPATCSGPSCARPRDSSCSSCRSLTTWTARATRLERRAPSGARRARWTRRRWTVWCKVQPPPSRRWPRSSGQCAWHSSSTSISSRARWTRPGSWVRGFHVVCWGVPAGITAAAIVCGALGNDDSLDSSGWCWVRRHPVYPKFPPIVDHHNASGGALTNGSMSMMGNMTAMGNVLDDRRARTFWLLMAGKGWEMLAYLLTILLYLGIKYHIYSEVGAWLPVHACVRVCRRHTWVVKGECEGWGVVKKVSLAANRCWASQRVHGAKTKSGIGRVALKTWKAEDNDACRNER